MKRDELIRHIGTSSAPVSTVGAGAAVGLAASPETHAAIDVLLDLSPEVHAMTGGWTVSADTRDRRVLAALRTYVEAHPDKRVFRGAAALGHLAPGDQPTEQELRTLLAASGEFKLLANAMIKRES